MATADLFTQINNAVLDLQNSSYSSFERPIKVLARLLKHPDLTQANTRLTQDLDIEAFLASQGRGNGMVGADKVEWPDDPDKTLGLTLLLIYKFADQPDFMAEFGYTFFNSGSKLDTNIHAVSRQLIIPFVRDYRAYVLNNHSSKAALVIPESNKVFIVHGHDEAVLHNLARFIEKLGLEAIVLREQPNQGRTIIEKFEAVSAEVGFAVVLFTPDDVGGSVKSDAKSARARQNVVFELGFFAGRLGRGRVCLLRKGDVEVPSDLFGVIYTDLDDAEGWKASLVREMKAAKLDFDANRIYA